MVRDRIEELRRISDLPATYKEVVVDIAENDLADQIYKVLNEYQRIRQWIEDIRSNIDKMKQTIVEMAATFRNAASRKSLPEDMEKTRQANMSLCQRVYTVMKALETDIPHGDDYAILSRIKRLHFYCIREDFLNVWQEHERFLMGYEDRLKKALKQHAKIVDANITEEETEALIANNTTSLFVGNIIEETDTARKTLRELLIRHSELEKIERSLTEVRDMFLRISTLVMEQSPLIQVVEYHAMQATINIDKGNEQLEKARENRIKALKKKTWLLFWLIVILVIIIILLVFVD